MEILLVSCEPYPTYDELVKNVVDYAIISDTAELCVVYRHNGKLRLTYILSGFPVYDFYLGYLTPDGLEFFTDYKLFKKYRAKTFLKTIEGFVDDKDHDGFFNEYAVGLAYITAEQYLKAMARINCVVAFIKEAEKYSEDTLASTYDSMAKRLNNL